ncbi:CHAT domain-containing protein [Catellatospora sp. TT07R-123]|uniref:CHAT domain-containing tetratricopeptide repeat protein n=1 Tax=Catellatospora sp. TT07R-123 TaxID=2733863 RepID=UPI001B0884C9|nr:CHAT domain-containing protein [Catellatospora sp. TT07R-123]GHJ47596.1 CHAT domain-containing protein [Catellatospora sp. TT07R-123]
MPTQWLRRRMTGYVGVELTDSTIADGRPHDLLAAALQIEARLPRLAPDDPLRVPQALRAAWLRLRLLGAQPAGEHLALAEAAMRTLAATPPGHPLAAAVACVAARTLSLRAQRDGDPATLHAAEQALDAAVAHLEAAPLSLGAVADLAAFGFFIGVELVEAAHSLGVAHQLHFERGRGAEHIDRAVELLESSYDDMMSVAAVTRLARALAVRDRDGDLDAAIEQLDAAIGASAEEDEHYPPRLMLAAQLLSERFRRTAHVGDLDAAVSRAAESVASTPAGWPLLGTRQSVLSDLMVTRFEQTSRLADLDHGLATARHALAAVPAGLLPTLRAAYAGCLLRAHSATGADDLLDTAADLLAEDGDRVRDGSAGWGLDIHIGLMTARGQRDGEPERLDEALRLSRRQPQTGAGGDHARLNLAMIRLARHRLTGDTGDLDAAITDLVGLADGAAGTAIEFLRVPVVAVQLGRALLGRSRITGDAGDLAAAIERLRAAAAACPPEHTQAPAVQASLAEALLNRHARLGTQADLDASIVAYRAAVAATTTRSRHRDFYQGELSRALLTRYGLRGDAADAREAVDASWSALAVSPAVAGHRAGPLTGFGAALLGRYRADGDPADLDEAVTALTWAVAAGRDGTEAAGTVAELVRALLLRSGAHGDASDLELAQTELVRAEPAPGHPDRGLLLLRWGQVLAARFGQGEQDCGDAAYRRFARAAADPVAAAAIRFQAATAAAALATGRDDAVAAADAYALAVELLPLLVWRGLDRTDQERWLIEAGAVTADAAAWALAAGRPRRAVEVVEAGRAVLWDLVLQLRTDLRDLAAAYPDRAAALESVRAALLAQDTRQAAIGPDGGELDRRIALTREWDRLVAQVRQDPRFADFLRLPTYDRLAGAAQGGPVVLVNIAGRRSDALIVGPGEPVVVPLEVTPADVAEQVAAFLAGIDHEEAAQIDVAGTLRWLWERVALPVLTALGHTGPLAGDQAGPRVWWCPTGPLALLPIHAAADGAFTDGVPHRVAPSYTPTLRTLISARERARAAAPLRRAALVGMSQTPGEQQPLNIEQERAVLRDHSGGDVTELVDAAATREGVLALLRTHSWVHLACHGFLDPARPDASGIVVAGGDIVAVRDIARLALSEAELAYLSACSTAKGDRRLPDEAVHLAAAIHLAGFTNVVATHWPVLDRDSRSTATAVYGALREGGMSSAHTAAALHRAVRALLHGRARHQPMRWAVFSHTGI